VVLGLMLMLGLVLMLVLLVALVGQCRGGNLLLLGPHRILQREQVKSRSGGVICIAVRLVPVSVIGTVVRIVTYIVVL
jgi:hypothetical protein